MEVNPFLNHLSPVADILRLHWLDLAGFLPKGNQGAGRELCPRSRGFCAWGGKRNLCHDQ
jgi:hypothetical protein